MSTYWYFECLSHTPAIRSDDEFTQHTDDDLYKMGIDMAYSRPFHKDDMDEMCTDSSTRGQFQRAAFRFLVQHPECKLGITNEYGVHEPLPGKLFEVRLDPHQLATLGGALHEYQNGLPEGSGVRDTVMGLKKLFETKGIV